VGQQRDLAVLGAAEGEQLLELIDDMNTGRASAAFDAAAGRGQ
jgi:hypothetical protein